MTRNILITGGAGYIGSHVVASLQKRRDRTVIVDNLSTGLVDRVDSPIERLDVSDADTVPKLTALLIDNDISGIVHLAAQKRVDESIEEPLRYWRENMGGLRNVLEAAVAAGTKHFVFSSSAAVYGSTSESLVNELTPTQPINPYGETKLAGEWLVNAMHATGNLSTVNLRYFNVVGASAPHLADNFDFNLFGQTFRRIAAKVPPAIYGDDYNTPDGTCVRDYVHVQDLADAHVAALDALESGAVTRSGLQHRHGNRLLSKRGDPRDFDRLATRRLCPNNEVDVQATPLEFLIPSGCQRLFGWTAQYDLQGMVSSAWDGWVQRRE